MTASIMRHRIGTWLSAITSARDQLGLGVGAGSLRAVGVRRGRIMWALDAELEPGESVADAIAVLLAAAPRPRWRRPAVSAAVGPSAVQTKSLAGLPPLTDAAVVERLVREGAGRFFLMNGVPLTTGGVRVDAPGTAWAAAFEAPLVAALEAGCRAARLRLRAVVPTVAVLGASSDDSAVWWSDGDVRVHVALSGRRLTTVRRLGRGGPAAEKAQSSPSIVPALAVLGSEAWRYADAYGAAVLGAREPTALRFAGRSRESGVTSRWRIGVAVGVLAACVIAVLIAPGLAAERVSRNASTRLAALGAARRDAARGGAQVRAVSAALAEVAAFSADARSPTLLIASLTRALPEGSAVVAVRVDTAGGTLVALAPRAAMVLGALERVPGLIGPEIVGPVTREIAGTREVERVTVRFRLGGSTSSSPGTRR